MMPRDHLHKPGARRKVPDARNQRAVLAEVEAMADMAASPVTRRALMLIVQRRRDFLDSFDKMAASHS